MDLLTGTSSNLRDACTTTASAVATNSIQY